MMKVTTKTVSLNGQPRTSITVRMETAVSGTTFAKVFSRRDAIQRLADDWDAEREINQPLGRSYWGKSTTDELRLLAR